MTTSDVEMKSDDDERREKRRGREEEKEEKDRKKHKKHKKDKKKHRRRDSSGADTAGEGGDTPEKEKVVEAAIPGLAKYESEGEEEGEIEKPRRGRSRSRSKGRSRSRERRGREEKEGRSREEREGRGREEREGRGRERDEKEGRGREREEREEKEGRGREREDKMRSGRDREDKSRRRSKSRDKGKEEKRGREREGRGREEKEGKSKEKAPEEGEVEGPGQQVISLSIEETNKLRLKLGLKPLNMGVAAPETEEEALLPGELIPGDRDRTRHLAPQHWGERDRTKKLSERIATSRDLRGVKAKLAAVKGLGDESSDEDDAGKWIQKQRKKVNQKEEAAKRAKAMEELDNEFGVGELVTSQLKKEQQKEYDSKNLSGLKVGHSAEAFGESTTVLTLEDGDILSDKYEDVLMNVNIVDDERTKKSLQNVRDFKEGYKAYDSEVNTRGTVTKFHNSWYLV